MPDNNISPMQRLSGLSLKQGMEIPTQICYSNKEGIRTYCQNIIEYLQTHPHVKMIGLWPTDLGHYCECKKCTADSQVILKASIYIAQQLAKKFSDVIVEHLVYNGPSLFLPDDNLEIPKNMIVLRATGDQKIIDSWIDKCRKSGSPGMYKIIYTLADNFQQQGHVCINFQKTKEESDYLRSHSFQGFNVMYIDMYSYWRSCQNLSFFAGLAWGESLSIDAYLEDFCKSYYGDAHQPMQILYRKLLELNQEALFGDSSEELYEQNSTILSACQEFLNKARKNVYDNKIKSRLNKMDVYLNHLKLYSELSFYLKKSQMLLNEKKISEAAVMMHQVALKEEEIKTICFDSFFRGDGVLDPRLTLLLRKFDRFRRYRDMINKMLNRLKTQSKGSVSVPIQHED